MRDFAYHKPSTVAEALALLAAGNESRPLSGGMTLLPTIKQRLAAPGALIDLGAMSELSGIMIEGGSVTIGAMTTHAEVARSEALKATLPALATLAGLIGDPAADYPAAALGLGATIVTDRREIAADAFFVGMFQTALASDEIITAVRFPIPDAAGYAKFKSQASRFALVGAFVAKFGDTVRAAITGAASVVFRSKEIEEALRANFSPAALMRISIAPYGLNSDIHADSEYRAHLVVVMARRAVEQAMAARRSS